MSSAAGAHAHVEDFRLGYRPALDGIRGVSILAVMLYHTGLLSGGFLGVDVFFVLSGFLITRLLLEEFTTTRAVSLRAFYVRRALRLLPALGPVVLVAGVAMIAWAPTWATIGYVVSVILYSANWATIYGLPPALLGHAWSLSVEEQFYLLWPLCFLVIIRLAHRRAAVLALMVGAVLAAVAWRFSLIFSGASLSHIYAGLDAHADPVLIGCALALYCGSSAFPRTPRARACWDAVGAAAGLALVGLLVRAHFPVDYVVSSASTIAGIASALVIVAAVLPSSRWSWILGREPLQWIGRRSYALYLWHFPLLYMADALWVPGLDVAPTRAAIAWTLTFAAAAASFRYIERPALALKATLAGPRTALGAPRLLGAQPS